MICKDYINFKGANSPKFECPNPKCNDGFELGKIEEVMLFPLTQVKIKCEYW